MPAPRRRPSPAIALAFAAAVRPAIAAVVAGSLLAAAGCTATHPDAASGALNPRSTKILIPGTAAAASPATPTAAGSHTEPAPGSAPPAIAAAGSQALPPGAISANLAGIPSTITAGGPAVEFTATFTNRSTVGAANIAPLFQIVGGPCNCALGTLQRFDSKTGTWRVSAMPEGDGDPNFLAEATGGVQIPPGTSVTIRYRLTLAAANPPKALFAILYAVALPRAIALAHTTVPSQLITG